MSLSTLPRSFCVQVRSFVGERGAASKFADALRTTLNTGCKIGDAKSKIEVVNRGAIYAGLFTLYAGPEHGTWPGDDFAKRADYRERYQSLV